VKDEIPLLKRYYYNYKVLMHNKEVRLEFKSLISELLCNTTIIKQIFKYIENVCDKLKILKKYDLHNKLQI